MTLAPWRLVVIGAALPPTLLAILTAATAVYWSDGAALGTLARVVEGLAPQCLALAMVSAGMIWLLGARRLGLVLMVMAGLSTLWIAGRHLYFAQYLDTVLGERGAGQGYAAPAPDQDPDQTPDQTPDPALAGQNDLTVLWFNTLSDNRMPAGPLIAALGESGADVIVLGEAMRLAPLLAPLKDQYPYQLGCTPTPCGSVMLSRFPLADTEIPPWRGIGPGRTLIARLILPDGRDPVSLMAVHVVKPWFYGFSELEEWWIFKKLQDQPHPLVLMGDFNAAPWSRRLTTLYLDCAMVPAPWPPATWPARAGRFGVPIDHVLTRGGPRIVTLDAWGGREFGSNHRGLLARIALPDSPQPRPPCSDPRTHPIVPPADRLP